MMKFNDAKNKLANIWFIGGFILLLLMIIITFAGSFNQNNYTTKDAWAWFMPTLLPILTIIITERFDENQNNNSIKKSKYALAKYFSLIYIFLIFIAIVAPGIIGTKLYRLEIMNTSNFWLGPIQSLVMVFIFKFYKKTD